MIFSVHFHIRQLPSDRKRCDTHRKCFIFVCRICSVLHTCLLRRSACIQHCSGVLAHLHRTKTGKSKYVRLPARALYHNYCYEKWVSCVVPIRGMCVCAPCHTKKGWEFVHSARLTHCTLQCSKTNKTSLFPFDFDWLTLSCYSSDEMYAFTYVFLSRLFRHCTK